MKVTEAPVITEQTFDTPIDAVWNALTEVDQIPLWFFENIESFKAKVGFETQFNVKSCGREFLHLWKVTEVVPRQKIVYNWKYGSCPGDSFVSFELSEENNRTHLILTHRVTENFPDDVPEFSRASCAEGWNYFIKERLKAFLESR